jgi:hypothetical protein
MYPVGQHKLSRKSWHPNPSWLGFQQFFQQFFNFLTIKSKDTPILPPQY